VNKLKDLNNSPDPTMLCDITFSRLSGRLVLAGHLYNILVHAC
jgi:hypothetical protein